MKKYLATAATAALLGTSAAAHTIGIGWLDNGDGTVTLYAEHWHGNQTTAYSDNGGLGVYDSMGTFLYKTPWVGVINDQDLNGDGNASGASTTPSVSLTGYVADANHGGYPNGTDDWFYSAPLTLGNGDWGFFTGYGCCVDTMSGILYANVTGISSVDPGTGPGAAPVPLPAAGGMLLAGVGAFAAMRRRKKA